MTKGPIGKAEINLNGERLVSSELLLDEIKTHVRYSQTYVRQLTREEQIPATKWHGRWWYSPMKVLQALFGADFKPDAVTESPQFDMPEPVQNGKTDTRPHARKAISFI